MDEPIYFKQYSHPHPIIRILNIINNIAGYAVHLADEKGIPDFVPDKDRILKIFIEVGEELSASMLLGVPFQKFVGELMLYRGTATRYINDLNRGVEGMDRSAVMKFYYYT